ncbi:MAG: single-stranded-DNA-specific exonuclease RecJ, partial [Chloroflexota bacterium]
MKRWLDPVPLTVPDELLQAVGGHVVVAERLVRQGIMTPLAAETFLSPAAYKPASPYEMPDMDRAVTRLQKAIAEHEHILVWGDFDVDGQTSTALLVSALKDLGAQVVYHIPNRFTEGHGIHLPTLNILLKDIDLLLTCDTGITANSAIHLAHMHHVDVVITDHHALPYILPEAEAIINPMLLHEGHPLRELPGVGTAYQLVRALYDETPSDHLLDLVALGIVADVMVQVDDTRYWLQRGLEVLRNAPRPGIQAILERAEINPPDLTESDIGFSIGPRLNALGRLADANPAVELLTTSDKSIITERVNELEGLNQKRRFLTRQVYEGAQQKIEADDSLLKYAALVVSGEGWHSGVVGIVASRLAEDYACPVIIFSENEGLLSGSARSVAGCNIIEAIRSQSSLLKTFGGHNMAAGLSLPTENLFEFRRGLSSYVRESLGTSKVEPQLAIDA